MRARLAASGPKAAFEAILRLYLLRLRAPADRYRQSCTNAHVSRTARAGEATDRLPRLAASVV